MRMNLDPAFLTEGSEKNVQAVRVHGSVARIEVPPEDIPRFADEELRRKTYEEFRTAGFSYTALDLLGYRTGSLNEALPESEGKE